MKATTFWTRITKVTNGVFNKKAEYLKSHNLSDNELTTPNQSDHRVQGTNYDCSNIHCITWILAFIQ